MANLENNINCQPSKTMSCPWGKVQNSPPVSSFSTLMDEEYAKELQLEESQEIDVSEFKKEGIISNIVLLKYLYLAILLNMKNYNKNAFSIALDFSVRLKLIWLLL